MIEILVAIAQNAHDLEPRTSCSSSQIDAPCGIETAGGEMSTRVKGTMMKTPLVTVVAVRCIDRPNDTRVATIGVCYTGR